MSAQRRTTVKEKPASGNSDTAVPAARPKEKPVKDRSGTERRKAVEETRTSVIAARWESVRTLFRDSVSEMKKVNWPDQQTTRNLTLLVIALSIILGILLGGIDYILQRVFAALS
jgi:preprotein translocase subunit SecE